MKSSRQISLIVSGSLALLAIPLFAQSGSGAPSSAGSTSSTPATTPSSSAAPRREVDPMPPYKPTNSGTSSSSANAPDSATPVATPGVDTVRTPGSIPPSRNPYDPTAANSSPATSPTNSRADSTGASDRPANTTPGVSETMPWATQFGAYDTDHDGRLSLSEFQASPATVGSSTSSVNSGSSRSANSPNTTRSAGAPGSRTDPNPSTSTAPGMSSSTTSSSAGRVDYTQTFRQLDANHDGYLTQAEIDAYRSSMMPQR